MVPAKGVYMDRRQTTWTFLCIGILIVAVGLCGYLGYFLAKDQTSTDRQLVSTAGAVWTSPGIVKITEFRSGAESSEYQRLPEALEDPRVEEWKRINRGEMIDAVQMQSYRDERLSNAQRAVPVK